MRSTDHPQDDLLIVEALYRHGHDLEESDPDRADRAWQLARDIAGEHGRDVADALFQLERKSDTEGRPTQAVAACDL